jgi:rhodanese-related sulfurtransferase
MQNVRGTILQATAILALGFIAGFAFNAVSRNGIDPFKKPSSVPVLSDSAQVRAEGIRVITLEEARRKVEGGVQIIDARRKADFVEGHIPGALLLDYYAMGTYMDDVLPLLSNEREIMLYCSEISCDDSELLAKELYSIGFKKLLVFRGGFVEWAHAGLPVERGLR